MHDAALSPTDETFLDELLDRAVHGRSTGEPLDLEALLENREHLRQHALQVLVLAAEIATVQVPTPDAVAPRSLEGFTLFEEVGRGGMGIVYRAQQERLGRTVAFKVLAPSLTASARARERFAVEARAMARVQHPNVVAIHDVVATDDVCAYAMEWIEGATLASAIATGDKRLDVPAIARIGVTIAQALAAVHAVGLVHRDVKPSNILLRADGTPVLTDFSLVRDAEHSTHTATGEFLGTAAFAAPEQLRGEHPRIGPWTDVYALGVTLYAALCGQTPFGTTSTADLLRRIEAGTRQPLRALNPLVPRDLDTVVAKAMDPVPSRRYQTATELADDLARLLRFEPIRARPAGLLLRVQRFVERSPQLALALAGLLVALLLGLGGSVWFMFTLMRQAEELRAAEHRARNEAAVQADMATFLRWVFREGDASGWGRTDMTVLEALERSSNNLATQRGAYRPESELVIRMMVAETFVNMGRAETALAHLTAAQEIARTVHGPDSAQAGEVAQHLGRVHRVLGRLDDAERELRSAVRVRRMVQGLDQRLLAQSLQSLGILLRHRERYAEAGQHHAEALEIYRREQGEQSDNVALVLHSIASLQAKQGQLAEAEVTDQQALAVIESVHKGRPSLDRSVIRFGLGMTWWKGGRVVEGERAMRDALAETRTLVGTRHRQFADQTAALASALMESQPIPRHAEAADLRRESLASYTELGNPVAARAQGIALADLLLAGSRDGEAEPILVQTLELAKETEAQPECLRRLGTLRTRLRRFAEAEADLTRAWSLLGEAHLAERHATATALAEMYERWSGEAPDADRVAKVAEWRTQRDALVATPLR